MAVYTVHAPPVRGTVRSSDAERFVFVKDGFSLPAFLVAPLWLGFHRLWLALLGYLAAVAVLGTGLALAGITGGIALLAFLCLALFVGAEGGTLHRWTLAQRDWRELGVVVATDHDAAERRFFNSWTASDMTGSGLVRDQQTEARGQTFAAAPPGVIGLFPEPEARR